MTFKRILLHLNALLMPILVTFSAYGQALTCKQLFMQHTLGEQFLVKQNQQLPGSGPVLRESSRYERRTGVSLVEPVQKVVQWIKQLSAMHAKAENSDRTQLLLKNVLYKTYVIKPQDVPESFFALQIRINRERGMGDVALTPEMKSALVEALIKDQQTSLDSWIDYFFSKETKMYPMWAKAWIVLNVVKLAKFEQDTATFTNRSKTTTNPFVELNREALALVFDAIVKKVEKKSLAEISDPQLVALLEGAQFAKLYAHSLTQSGYHVEKNFTTNEGRWVTFPKGSDHRLLAKSLLGKNTGWCTAGSATAESQLAAGDFHVYYSLDVNQRPTIPRIAIRMEENTIAEVRGVDASQNLDPRIQQSPVLRTKLKEFGHEADVYNIKQKHMALLTAIDTKFAAGLNLTAKDLRFLYEIDEPIQGFGYSKDPRVGQIKMKRVASKDISLIFKSEVTADQIATVSQLISSNTRIFYGSIDMQKDRYAKKSLKDLKLIIGDLIVKGSFENVQINAEIAGRIIDSGIHDVKKVRFKQPVRQIAWNGVHSIEDIVFPPKMQSLRLLGNRSRDTLLLEPSKWVLPMQVEYLELSLLHAQGLVFPQKGTVFLYRLGTFKDLVIPENSTAKFIFPVMDLENLIIPANFKGSIEFQTPDGNLPPLNGLKIPKGFKGKIKAFPFFDNMPGDGMSG